MTRKNKLEPRGLESDHEPEPGIASRLDALKGDQSVLAFAKKCGIGESLMRKYLSGSIPGADKLVQIAQRNHASIEWLATGEGKIRPSSLARQRQSDVYRDLMLGDEDASDRRRERLSETAQLIRDAKSEAKSELVGSHGEFALIPTFDVAASAGHGAVAEDNGPSRNLAFRRDWLISHHLPINKLAVIEVRGDSMSPTLSAGDTILVDRSENKIGDDAIYVLRLDGHLHAKRLQSSIDGSVRVISDNPAYPDQVIELDRLEGLHIIGRVVWVGRFLI